MAPRRLTPTTRAPRRSRIPGNSGARRVGRRQAAHRDRILRAFIADARAKYNRGQAEHRDNLWERTRLLDDAIEEAIDLVFFLYSERERRR